MKHIIEKTFTTYPNPLLIKEFFSFFREIFYYNQDMDNVDFNLACDTLETMNSLLRTSYNTKERRYDIEHANFTDYFYFSY